MGKVSIKLMVEGGKAIPGPPLGPALAQHKLNIGQVISQINDKTKEFSGITVPVEVQINTDDKSFEINVGTPPVSQLIKKEIKVEKLAKAAWKEPAVGDITVEQASKIARAKLSVLGTKNIRSATKEVVASCLSLGVTVEGKNPKEIMKEISDGKFDSYFK